MIMQGNKIAEENNFPGFQANDEINMDGENRCPDFHQNGLLLL
jgi:hypothetical protein